MRRTGVSWASWLWSVGLVVSAACADDAVSFVDVEGLSAFIVVDEGLVLTAEAHAVAARGPVVRRLDESVTTWVLGYEASLDALELPAGALTLGEAGGAFPTPTRAWRVDAAGVQPDARAAAFADLRIAERTGCRRFTSRTFNFPRVEREDAAALLPLADGALLTTTAGRFVRLTRTAAEALSLPAGTPYQGGWSGRGESWLVGPGFASGSLEAGFRVHEGTVPLMSSGLIRVDGPHDPSAPFELFAIDAAFAVAHFDGLTWRRVFEPPSSPVMDGARSIAWIAPGRAAVVGTDARTVLEIDAAGGVTAVPIDVPQTVLNDALWRIAWVDGFGPLLGTRDNVVFQRGDARWTQLAPSPVTPRADVFIALGDGGFLAGGMDGVFGQWTRFGTTCVVELVGVGDTASHATAFGGEFLFVSVTDDALNQWTVMTPLPR